MCSQLLEQGLTNSGKIQRAVAEGLSLLGRGGVKFQMWCSKHHPASRVKTGELAEDPEDKQRTMGGLYVEQPCNHNTDWSCKNASSSGHKYVPGTRAKHTNLGCHHLRKAAQKLSVWMKECQQAWISVCYHICSLWLWEFGFGVFFGFFPH